MQLTPQQKRILDFLKKNGSINPLEALMECGVYRLSDVIFKLRSEHDFEIETKMTKGVNRFKEKVSYATYVLKD